MWALLSVYIDKCLEAKNGKFFLCGFSEKSESQDKNLS